MKERKVKKKYSICKRLTKEFQVLSKNSCNGNKSATRNLTANINKNADLFKQKK